jgi:hypothetical protein
LESRHKAQAAHALLNEDLPELLDLSDDTENISMSSMRAVPLRPLARAEESEDDAENILKDAVFSTDPPARLKGKLPQPIRRSIPMNVQMVPLPRTDLKSTLTATVGTPEAHTGSGLGLSIPVTVPAKAPPVGISFISVSSTIPAPTLEEKKESKEEKLKTATEASVKEQESENKSEEKRAPSFRVTRITPDIKHSAEDEFDFKSWEDYARGHIGAAMDAKNIDRFKFLIGPAFSPILSRLKNKRDLEIDTRNFHALCKNIFYERAIEGIAIFGTYIKNKALLLSCQQKVVMHTKTIKKTSDKSIAFLERMTSSHNAMELKEIHLEAYKTWIDANSNEMDHLKEGIILNTGPIALLQDNTIELTPEIKTELKKSLLKWINPWIENEVYRKFSIVGASKEQVISYLTRLQEKLISKLLKELNLKLLKHKLQRYSLTQRRKDEKIQQFYHVLLEKEKVSFRKFATEFLNTSSNRTELMEFLAPTVRTLKGKSVSELIELMIKYKLSYDRLFSDQEWLARIFASLEKIKDNQVLHKQFEEVLEKHCLTPDLCERLAKAKLIDNDILKRHPKEENLSKEEIISRNASLESAYLRTPLSFINKPLNEYQLSLILNYFSCTTQPQILLKKIIKQYLASEFDDWLPWARSFSSKSATRNRQIQYLISSLYKAKETARDLGVIFNDPSSKDEIRVGVNLVLEIINQEKPHYSWLQKKLQACLALLDKRHAQQFKLQGMSAEAEFPDLLAEFEVDNELLESAKIGAKTQDSPLVKFSINRPATHVNDKASRPEETKMRHTWFYRM